MVTEIQFTLRTWTVGKVGRGEDDDWWSIGQQLFGGIIKWLVQCLWRWRVTRFLDLGQVTLCLFTHTLQFFLSRYFTQKILFHPVTQNFQCFQPPLSSAIQSLVISRVTSAFKPKKEQKMFYEFFDVFWDDQRSVTNGSLQWWMMMMSVTKTPTPYNTALTVYYY